MAVQQMPPVAPFPLVLGVFRRLAGATGGAPATGVNARLPVRPSPRGVRPISTVAWAPSRSKSWRALPSRAALTAAGYHHHAPGGRRGGRAAKPGGAPPA